MIEFNKLSIAREFKCAECDQYAQIWLQGEYLDKYGEIPKDQLFQDQILKDLEQHIRDAHPLRAQYFLNEGDFE